MSGTDCDDVICQRSTRIIPTKSIVHQEKIPSKKFVTSIINQRSCNTVSKTLEITGRTDIGL